MNMPAHPAIIRATVAADGRLLSADAPVLALQQEAGGDLGSALAVPQLAAMARLAAHLGIALSRPVVAAAERGDIDMWVRAKPEAERVQLSIIDWHERQAVAAPLDLARRETDIAALSDGWTWQIDTQLRFQMVHEGLGGEGALPSAPPLPGSRFTSYFELRPDAEGDLAILRGFAQRRAFRDQVAGLTSDPAQRFMLSGFPMFDLAGQLVGYRGKALPVDRAVTAPLATPEPLPFYPAEFGKRLDRSLRRPLGRIIANADSIGAQLEGPLRPDYLGYASDISAAGRHLMALIDDLADLQAIDRPDFSVTAEEIDLADVGRRAAGLFLVKAQDRGISILAPALTVAEPAIGEFRRALQILMNLVGNAVRYAPEGSAVRIETGRSDGEAWIAVLDQGDGIAADSRERIFDKFERLGRSDAGGSGLGLYISRRLACAMGGDIRIDDAPEGGARFTLLLPALGV
ncbi:HAMP domain-containing histidine kinase [Sphingobium fuliginis]|jgi:signal transduction histidine kinase|uniref:histidine kinase n=1 Tax=Sphingobium fuliginis (strain ATCC 27551) TaxID=336203 RepID=A0A7M2GH29_SPHSA|nr:HAMP domain-containing sensor histidine kinase [Sphingobium fuliginis]QOT72026.1 HAMP domain-containing histidine kinase [Sphingobium fuliginis]